MFQLKYTNERVTVRPFLKWAGGKTQILPTLIENFPKELQTGKIQNYYEPFLGGGAVFFHIIQNYPVEKAFLYDKNPDIILVYQVVKNDVEALIYELNRMKNHYLKLDETDREEYFYDKRHKFNHLKENVHINDYSNEWANIAALIIFLNKTCFNGLYRLNKNGHFNVPFGKYTNPEIFNESNLREASKLLQLAEVKAVDFMELEKDILKHSFIYFDPPYRPISKTANFTSYSKFDFNDKEQIRLSKVFKHLDKKTIKLMLSNSDPKNISPRDNFFDDLYCEYKIARVKANRMINCNGQKRGKITELVITNY